MIEQKALKKKEAAELNKRNERERRKRGRRKQRRLLSGSFNAKWNKSRRRKRNARKLSSGNRGRRKIKRNRFVTILRNLLLIISLFPLQNVSGNAVVIPELQTGCLVKFVGSGYTVFVLQ